MLNEDYREILQLLLEEKVEFIVVGAYALGVHGIPRATGDIDIWVNPSEDNSIRLYQVLQKFGAPLNDLSAEDFTQNDLVFQIGIIPRRIDLMTQIDGVEFDEAYKEKILVNVDNLEIPVISLNLLIKNKSATGRDKDKLDVKLLRDQK